ncbi:MAG TPA: helix-turn-helix domain-containing protein [Marmoricola sp.]|nr:helix-turn-helix domain-containing protein [Marmoricola sp.]
MAFLRQEIYSLEMDDDLPRDDLADIAGIAALADPLRWRLYRYVARSAEAVGREQAADAVGVPVHTAKFHLDRMVDDGLLAVEFRRLTGRSGPGAGRPAKLYRRAGRDFAVSLPERHYDLLSEVLADAAAASVERRVPVDEVAPEVARRRGRKIGEAHADAGASDLERLADTLDEVGYEPRVVGARMVLENCPFDRVAREHTALVCGLNVDFVGGVVDGLGCRGLTASLEPSPGRCCVSVRDDGEA